MAPSETAINGQAHQKQGRKRIMNGFKGFKKGLVCDPTGNKPFQYEYGKSYEIDGEISVCENGFHFCELPHQVFNYYAPGTSEFAKVVGSGQLDTSKSDKVACSKIEILSPISVSEMVENSVKCFFEKFKFEEKINAADAIKAGNYGSANAGDNGVANAGNYGSANAGDNGSAMAGYRGSANVGNGGAVMAGNGGSANAGDNGSAMAGDGGVANAGDNGSAMAGYRGSANVGNGGAAMAGDYGVAKASYRGSAMAGYRGSAIVGRKGAASVKKNGIAVAFGNEAKAKGEIGSVLVLTEWDENDKNIIHVKSLIVDGTEIKPDTYYTLKNNEVVTADSEE